MEEMLEDFIEYMEVKRKVSENTLDAYRRDLKSFLAFLISQNILKLEKVNQTSIRAYLLNLHQNGKAVSTISRNIVSLRAFFQFLYIEGVIKEIPTIDIEFPKKERKLPEILSLEEVEILLCQPDTEDLKGMRDKAMLEVLYATGIKVTELTTLKLDDLNLTLGYLKCSNSDKERIIPLGSKAVESLKIYLDRVRIVMVKEPEEETLFVNCNGTPMTRQGLWKIVKTYAKKANICENITPHILRHSFAAHLVANGADLQVVQEMMGYADISTTQVYTQVNKSKIREVYLKSHPRA